ncbi:helicase C-terminal domain-containing protein [Vibrio metschnikovii]
MLNIFSNAVVIPSCKLVSPEASKKLIQAVGRLLRKESDSGRVVLLDRRIVSKRYGKALLDALPFSTNY